MKFLSLVFAVAACASLPKKQYTYETTWKFYKKVGEQYVAQNEKYENIFKCVDNTENVQGECRVWKVTKLVKS
jgi:hypothetical protein